MKTKVENVGDCRKVVNVALGPDEVKEDYENVVKVYTKNARVPGFRPGKAPKERVEARYRKEIEKELQDMILPRAYHEMLKEEDITPVAIVDLKDVQASGKDGVTFTAVLDVKPTFKTPKFKKITIESKPVKVTDKDVDEAVKGLLQRMARYEDAESGTIEEQDLVQIDYKGSHSGGEPLDLEGEGVAEITDGTDHWLPVAGDNELIPGLLDAIKGKELGADIAFTATFPSDFRVSALAGRDIAYNVTIKGLRKMKIPELDEAVLKQIGMESEDALRKRVREDLETANLDQEEMKKREQVNTFLLENTKISVPDSQVTQERTSLLRNLLTRMAQQGATREMMEQHRDEMMANVSRQAEERVKLQYILEQIAAEEELKVEQADIDTAFAKLSEKHGMPVERLRAEIDKQDNGMEQFESDVLRDKVMDFLIGQAKIK